MGLIRQSMVVALVAVVSVSLGATRSGASQKFKKLSEDHVNFGVSQLLAGDIPNPAGFFALRLMNPNRVAQAAAVFVYERGREGFGPELAGGTPELFRGCFVRELTPHASLWIGDTPPGGPFPPRRAREPFYVEVISAPVEPVSLWKSKRDDENDDAGDEKRKRRVRLADGLGILANAGSNEGHLHLVHPALFSLPSDDVVEGQRQAAIDCVCGELDLGRLNPDLFEDFGVTCDSQ